MRFTITFKTPDTTDDAIKDAVFAESDCDCGLCPECREVRQEKEPPLRAVAEKFIEYGEYVYIELDTETGTATVLPIVRR